MNDKPWINAYPPGVLWDAEIVPGPVQSILDDAVAKWPDRSAVDFIGKRFTYRDLGELVNRAAKGLQQLGVKPGVHVGLYLPNSPHYIIAFFGVLKAGGTAVNYSPLDAAKVLEHKIEDSRTDFLITLDMASLYPQMAAMLGKTRLKKLVVGSVAELTADPDTVMTEMKARSALPNCSTMTEVSRPILSPIRPRRLPCFSIPAVRQVCRRARCLPMPISQVPASSTWQRPPALHRCLRRVRSASSQCSRRSTSMRSR
jgi:hypothetical protein